MSSPNVVEAEVFINFRGVELRNNFVDHLHSALHRMGINAFIDRDEAPGADLNIFLKGLSSPRSHWQSYRVGIQSHIGVWKSW